MNSRNLNSANKFHICFSDEFSAEDKVASLLRTTCYTLVQIMFTTAATVGVNNIYMCGNFVNPEIVRTNLTRDALSRAELSQQDPTKVRNTTSDYHNKIK